MISVLLIEDDDNDAALAAHVIEESALEISLYRATCISEGIEQLQEQTFALVILDLGLPGGSGIENVRKLRDFDYTLPIVVMTGWDDAISAKILQAGASEFMTKQALLDDKLIAAMVRILELPEDLLAEEDNACAKTASL